MQVKQRLSTGNSSTEKAFRLLFVLGDNGREMGVQELARAAGMDKATTHRFLITLTSLGVVERSPDTGRYRLGLRLFELGNKVAVRTSLVERATEPMERLAREVGETCHLASLYEGQVLYLQKIEADRNFQIGITRVGARVPAHCTALGKVLLAHLSEQELERIIKERGLPRFTPNTITDPETLKMELAGVRANGYALDRQEIEIGLACVGAPIFNSSGQVIAALSVAGPAARINEDALPRLIPLVKEAAAEISRHVAWGAVAISGKEAR